MVHVLLQIQSSAGRDVCQTGLLTTTTSVMESVSRIIDPVMENALMDVLIAMDIVTRNPPLTSIFGNVEANASVSPNLVTESAQMKEPCAEICQRICDPFMFKRS